MRREALRLNSPDRQVGVTTIEQQQGLKGRHDYAGPSDLTNHFQTFIHDLTVAAI